MFYCYLYWYKNQHPKFYNEAVAIMARANGKAFIEKKDLDAFVARLRNRLDMDKPEGHSAKVEVCSAQISIVSGKVDDTIARIHFGKIEGFLRYDLESGQFKETKEGGEV